MLNAFNGGDPWPYGLTLVTPPAEEPVTLTEAKQHLRVDIEDDDTLITVLLQAAREHIETVSRYQLVTATYRYDLACFPAVLKMPRPPLQSVTSLAYQNTAGELVTLDAAEYQVHASAIPGRITPVTTWPSVGEAPDAVQVTYVAGFGVTSAVPAMYKALILLLLGDLYEHREAETEARLTDNTTYQRLLNAARLVEV